MMVYRANDERLIQWIQKSKDPLKENMAYILALIEKRINEITYEYIKITNAENYIKENINSYIAHKNHFLPNIRIEIINIENEIIKKTNSFLDITKQSSYEQKYMPNRNIGSSDVYYSNDNPSTSESNRRLGDNVFSSLQHGNNKHLEDKLKKLRKSEFVNTCCLNRLPDLIKFLEYQQMWCH